MEPALRALRVVNAEELGRAVIHLAHEEHLARTQGERDWPRWCFVPTERMNGAVRERYSSVQMTVEIYKRYMEDHALATIAAGLAGWRVGKGVYRFDPDTFEEVWSTPIPTALPGEALRHLPEWTVYIPTPGKEFKGRPLDGFFAHLDENATSSIPKRLRLVLIFSAGDMYPLAVGVGLTVVQGMRDLLYEIARNDRAAHMERRKSMPQDEWEAIRQESLAPDSEIEEFVEEMVPELGHLVSLVLYLGAQNRDLQASQPEGGQPRNPKPKGTKKGIKLFPAPGPNLWRIGYRVGAALRSTRTQDGGSPGGSDDGQGPKKAPHLRRAHYHHYWTGPRKDPDKRKVVLRWLDPILVNADVQGADDRPVVLREVGASKE